MTLIAVLCTACATDRPRENFLSYRGTTEREGANATDGDSAAPSTTRPDQEEQDAGVITPLIDISACGEPAASAPSFSRKALRSAALACLRHQLCIFEASTRALTEATARYVESPTTQHRKQAQAAHRETAAAWAPIEVMQFGPLASQSENAGEDMYQGQSLRDQVQSWPLVSRCRVETQIAEQDYRDSDLQRLPVSARGLYAVQYALFADERTSACNDSSAAAQAFAGLDVETRARRQRQYGHAVAQSLRATAENLSRIYASDSDFSTAFIEASGYPSEQEALNVVASALIYIEREVKDWKLGIPAGVTITAPVAETESPYASMGGRLVQHNLEGFERIFFGCAGNGTGLGFDDWLDAAGHGELGADLHARYITAHAAAQSLPASLDTGDAASIMQAHTALRELTTMLKGEFFGAGSPLNLALPATVEGDTD